MKHYASTNFWRCFKTLPTDIQNLAQGKYELLKQNPAHSSLHFKLVYGGRYRTVRVGSHYRAIGVPVPDGVQWFWIGSHADYDKLLG